MSSNRLLTVIRENPQEPDKKSEDTYLCPDRSMAAGIKSIANPTKMPRLIAVTGATGNQGGSVAKLLLRYPEEYRVRAITRDAQSRSSKALANLGAEIVQADLTQPETLQAAVKGCWGVFGVTNFYDSVDYQSFPWEENNTHLLIENQRRPRK